ncbi:hypothetical protein B0H13DRAFT_1994195 [Mycena leptocephala]|nr:hypothetical protein B0H13DRAFT_1994195 [Mycena leptocephala]
MHISPTLAPKFLTSTMFHKLLSTAVLAILILGQGSFAVTCAFSTLRLYCAQLMIIDSPYVCRPNCSGLYVLRVWLSYKCRF